MNIQKFNPEKIWPEILERIANGESLASALRKPGMPSYELAKLHLRKNPELREAYDEAVRDRADHMAEGLLDLAAQPIPDDLEPAARSAWVQNKRVQIDVIKWVVSRQFRQAWGDRVDVSVTDGRVSVLAALEAANNRVLTIDQDNVE